MLELKFQFCLSLERISAKSGEFGVKEAPELHFLLLINCCGVFSFKPYLAKGKKNHQVGLKKGPAENRSFKPPFAIWYP